MLARAQLRQVPLPLLVGAVQVQVVHAQVRVRAVGQRYRGARPRQFLDRHQVREVAHAAAAEFLRHRHAEQAKLAQARPQVHREGVAAVDFVRQRRHLVTREPRHGVAQQVEFLTQVHVKSHRLPPVGECAERPVKTAW
jgi:hypothetical protein